jgi:hypothetical protein
MGVDERGVNGIMIETVVSWCLLMPNAYHRQNKELIHKYCLGFKVSVV